MTEMWDRALLIGTALLVCLVSGGAFWIADIYHINPAWIFFAGNSIFAVPMLWKPFHPYIRKPKFIFFFLVWICIHGATVVSMMLWLPVEIWPVVMLLELAVGFIIAKLFFGYQFSNDRDEDGGPKAMAP